jgi:hypothetical protein
MTSYHLLRNLDSFSSFADDGMIGVSTYIPVHIYEVGTMYTDTFIHTVLPRKITYRTWI